MLEINSERLVVRDRREPDLPPWAAMNADAEVRELLGPPLTAKQAVASACRFQDDLDRHGFGFWAFEVRDSGEFIGFAGLDVVDDDPDAEEGSLRRGRR